MHKSSEKSSIRRSCKLYHCSASESVPVASINLFLLLLRQRQVGGLRLLTEMLKLEKVSIGRSMDTLLLDDLLKLVVHGILPLFPVAALASGGFQKKRQITDAVRNASLQKRISIEDL
ncbi:hypothetical protein AVEN_116735-1 [Araneus ventricosus]|uniref:Uncharacterized protein n=1 Tax=Araneus ventricosus TaxID=182803 RepID=A0A4Y2QIL7_ARAVE|nr:hypothetical protein AVEN_116735-1 [Araneus ventricosus]